MALGEQRHAVFRNFPNALKIGMTATPYFDQLEGYQRRGIVEKDEEWTGLFTNLIHEMTLEEVMERGILSKLDVHLIKTSTEVLDIQISSSGDYRESDLRKYFATKARNALAIGMLVGGEFIPKEYQISKEQKDEIEKIHNKIAGKRTAIFAVDIEHAEELAEELRNQGVSASAVHSKIDGSTRGKILQSHSRGETQVVIGVDMLSIGWDSPATEVGIYLQPTYSGVVAVHSLGRILRPSPETGKQEAIAIQLVDQFTKRVDSPVLIPHIFDPEYVLRGSQTGKKSSGQSSTAPREKPLVSFSGMNIESIIQEAQSKELVKTRFTRGSLEEAVSLFRKLALDAKAENPDIGTYELSKIIVDQLPQRIPYEAQQKALQAFASIDTNTKRLGQEAFLLLNLKTLLSVVDSLFREELDSPADREEMMHEALVSVQEKLPTLKSGFPISSQVNRFAEDGVVEYLAKRENTPIRWMRDSRNRLIIAERIKEVFGEGNRILTNEEINNLARTLSEETGINENNLRHYINYRNSLRVKDEKSNEDQTFKEVNKEVTEETTSRVINEVLQTLTDRERRVLELTYGLKGNPKITDEEMGREFGVSRGRPGQIRVKALRKLRHPTRSRKFRDYLDGDDIIARPISIGPSESSSNNMPYKDPYLRSSDPYSIKTLGASRDVEGKLIGAGIKQIGDFFSASPNEIGEEWSGNKESLLSALIAATQRTYKLYDEVSRNETTLSESELFEHIVESVLYRGKNFALEGLTKHEKMAILKKLNLWDEIEFSKEEIDKFLALDQKVVSKIETDAQRAMFKKAYKDIRAYRNSLLSTP